MGTNGRTIIEAAINLCSYVAKHPDPTKWFDNTGSSGSTDDRINSTHDVEYDEVKPMTVIQEILEKAANPSGVKGFDVYETPSGVLVGHLRNSLDFVCPISIIPETYTKTTDVHRVRNKFKVYGKEDKKNPSDMDSWTESTTDWSVNSGTSLGTSTDRQGGSYSVRAYRYDWLLLELWRTFSQVDCEAWKREAFKRLLFWIKWNNDLGYKWDYSPSIRLFAPDSDNRFYTFLGSKMLQRNEWTLIDLPLGKNYEWSGGGEPELIWRKVGSPSWDNIQGAYFNVQWDLAHGSGANIELKVDMLHFGKARFSGLAEDATSQSAYGVRVAEPVVDEALQSDAECQAKAQSLRDFYKDPIVTLENVLVDGDYRFTPGDRLRVIVPNDALDAYFRITQIQEKIRGPTWDAVLRLSNEPVLVEKVLIDIIKQRNVDARRS